MAVMLVDTVADVVLRRNEAGDATNAVGVWLCTTANPPVAIDADAANLTAKVSVDGGSATTYAGATYFAQPSGMNAGHYVFTLPAAAVATGNLVVITFSHTTGTVSPKHVFGRVHPDWYADYLGASWTTTTDSMAAIRDYFDAYLLPRLRADASITDLSGSGWLSRIVTAARRWAGEAVTSAKFTPTTMLVMVQEAIRQLFIENLLLSDRQLLVRWSLTVDTDTMEYPLPPTVAQVHRVAQIDATTGRGYGQIGVVPREDCVDVGWTVEGGALRFTSKQYLTTGDVYQVLYTPNGMFTPHKGTITGTTLAGTTVVLPASVTDGALDYRPNAYAGYVFRVFASGGYPEEVRGVSAYAPDTRTLTLSQALTYTRASGDYAYEVVPLFDGLFEDLVALQVARAMAIVARDRVAVKLLLEMFAEKARAFRALISEAQMVGPRRFQNRDWGNADYAIIGGM